MPVSVRNRVKFLEGGGGGPCPKLVAGLNIGCARPIII